MKKNTSLSKNQLVFNIHYDSENSYPASTNKGILDYLLLPIESEDQHVVFSEFSVLPQCPFTVVQNHLDFSVYRVQINQNISQLNVDFNARVIKKIMEKPQNNSNGFYAINHEEEVEYYHFLANTKYTLLSLNHPLLNLTQNENESSIDYIIRLCLEILNNVQYQQHSTNTFSTASDSLAIGAGVCQDFSHILLGICRSHGIASRYVSGYFCTAHDEAQLHAWVEVYFSDIGWVGFDPTHRCLVDENYIKIAHGVDYSDCSSVKGLISTAGMNYTNYRIRISEIEQQQMQNQS